LKSLYFSTGMLYPAIFYLFSANLLLLFFSYYLSLHDCFYDLDDGKLDTESDSGEFWVLFGGFAPIGKKVANEDDIIPETTPAKLYRYYDLI